MTTLKQRMCVAAALVVGIFAPGAASASPMTFVMGFDDLPLAQYGEYVDNWYNGGCGGSYVGGLVDCGGPNYGAIWTGALAGRAPDGFLFQPSSPNAMTFGIGGATLNIPAGVPSGPQGLLTFSWVSPRDRLVVTVYDGLNGTGTLLSDFHIPLTVDVWSYGVLSFYGTARSVIFTSQNLGYIALDDVSFKGNTTTVPEPATIAMFGFGLLLLGGLAGARRCARRR